MGCVGFGGFGDCGWGRLLGLDLRRWVSLDPAVAGTPSSGPVGAFLLNMGRRWGLDHAGLGAGCKCVKVAVGGEGLAIIPRPSLFSHTRDVRASISVGLENTLKLIVQTLLVDWKPR